MATTYVSPKAATGDTARVDIHLDAVYCEFDIAADIGTAAAGGGGAGDTAFVINDVVRMVKVDIGNIIVDYSLSRCIG